MDLKIIVPIVYFLIFVAVTLFVLISLVGKSKKLKVVLVFWILLIVGPVALFSVKPELKKELDIDGIINFIMDPQGKKKPKPAAKLPARVNRIKTVKKPVSKTNAASQQKSMVLVTKARALWEGDDLTDPNLALKTLDQAIASDPNSAVAFNDRGKVHAKMGQYDRAIKDYERAVKIDPKFIKAYNNKGVVLYETNQYEDALKVFNKAIVLNPSFAIAYLNRGLANYQMDRIDRACKDFTKACELGECEGSDWVKKNKICKASVKK